MVDFNIPRNIASPEFEFGQRLALSVMWGVLTADPRNAARLVTADAAAWPTPRHSLRGYLQRFGYRSYVRVKRQRREKAR